MADDCGRCLSDLPDDLLHHILFFAPAREGAATAVLSWRWRWLWRTSGAVNLDSRSFKHPRSSHALFLRGAEKSLAATKDPIRRLTLFVAEGSEINLTRRRRRREDGSASSADHNLIEALQVLRIVNCTAAPPGASAAFPRLADLHLHGCNVSVEDLRSTIAAAPKMSTLHLESC